LGSELPVLCSLAFELSWDRRRGAKPRLARMYRVPPGWAWRLAVGPQLERGVRPQPRHGGSGSL